LKLEWRYREGMATLWQKFRQMALLLPLILFGCSGGLAPYVHNPAEFNRDSPNFAKEPTDIADVAICYNSSSSTPQDILALAESTCAQFGKVARFDRQDLLQCPLLTPARAFFQCVPPAK
jgi:hypothetical protein